VKTPRIVVLGVAVLPLLLALLAPLSLFSLGAGVTSCKASDASGKGAAGSASQGGGKGGKAGLSFAVDVMKVESQKIDYVVQAPGTLDAFERVQITSRVAGVVDKVSFREGQEIKKGDVLVVIESERFQLAVNSAKASYDRTSSLLADAEAQVARREGATKDHPGLITGEELATYKTKVLTAKADVALAAEALKVAQVNLRDAFVRAPMGGIVQTRTVETGQYVNTGFLMATLLRTDPMLLRFQVEPRDAPRLKTDMTVGFTMRETQRAYSAKITLVAGAAEMATHTVAVVAEVVDEGHKYWLRPGSFCDVTIDVGGTREAPLIPRTAARATDHGYIVYVVENDVAAERVVTLGMNTKNGWIEVRSGLVAGDMLVVQGAEALSTGVKVRTNKVSPSPSAAPSASGSSGAGEPGSSGSSGGSGADAAPSGSRSGAGAGSASGRPRGGRAGAAGAKSAP
jgi:RND family efflux transporter MFP subunit